ncbi:MAG: ABC transporter ATP-binding protein [Gordonia sp. (in: high G+C Gram-positive bacteria)]
MRPTAESASTLPDLAGVGAVLLVRTAIAVSPVLRKGFPLTVLLALVGGTGRIVTPLTVQHALDSGLDPDVVERSVAIGGVALVLAYASSVWLNRRLHGGVEAALAQLRRAGLRSAHRMSAATADRLPTADVVARLTNDIDQVTSFLQGDGIQFLTSAAQLVVALVLLLVSSWVMTMPVLLLSAGMLVAMLVIQRIIARRFDRARVDLSRMQSVIAESVVGAPVIRSTGIEERIGSRIDEALDRARDSLLHTQIPLYSNTSLGEATMSLMTVAVLLGGTGWALLSDPPRFTPGAVVAMVFIITFFVRPLQFVVQSLGEAQNAITGWRRALELATAPSAEIQDGVPLPPGPLGVRFSDVDARYGDGPLVLRGVSVDIAPGEVVAVVGRTGSGKSTFAKLLTRRVEPVGGVIGIGGIPVERIDTAAWVGRIVIVPQEPFLFEGTIGTNIALGRPGASEEDVLAVVERLGLSDWLSRLPDRLDTRTGLRGDLLSAGERQLVALARTALADPDLIVLDEATSALDPATDIAVQRALTALVDGRTTIAIAHRMVTAAAADRVLVFDDGQIVQSGSHVELLAVDGHYAKLFEAWRNRTPPDLTAGGS